MRSLLDISRSLGPESPTWPGDPPFEHAWVTPAGAGPACVSRLSLSPHLGSHVDAPLHLDPQGAAAAGIPLAACVGRCEVVSVRPRDAPLRVGNLPPAWYPNAPRVLFATGTWPAGTPVPAEFAALDPCLVDALADAGVVLVGIDTPSVDPPSSSDLPAHRRCLARDMVILEGLDLSAASPGLYTLLALPLRLVTAEASPVRAVLLTAGAIDGW